MDHTVADGETISTIAAGNGFHWETVWNDPGNEALRKKRKVPAAVARGDVVHIPELRQRAEPHPTTQRHVFHKRAGGVLPVLTWLEIELWDEATGKRVPGAAYEVTLGDGKVVTGELDGEGFAHLDAVDPRAAKVRFPAWDAADWKPGLPPEEEAKLTWVEIVVKDEDGTPLPDVPYKLTCADGSIRHGWTKEEGIARREDVPAGKCDVEFPRIDKQDWEAGEPPPKPDAGGGAPGSGGAAGAGAPAGAGERKAAA